MYYDKRTKKLYQTLNDLMKDHPYLVSPGSDADAQAYMFRNDIELLTPLGPSVAPDYSVYTLVPGNVDIENNSIQLVVTVRKDATPDKLRDVLWNAAKKQLDALYAKYTSDTPTVEQASWSLQLAEANYVKGYFETPEIMPAGYTPVLELMISQRKVANETVFDLAKLVLAAANRYAYLAANLVGQWQRVDKALKAATTVEELVAVDASIVDPVEKKM